MSRADKLLEKLLSMPRDFKYNELVVIMKFFGFEEFQGRGSRVRFVNEEGIKLTIHKPHPKPVLKEYQIKDVIRILKQIGGI